MKKLSVLILLLSFALLVGCSPSNGEVDESKNSSIQASYSDKGRTLTSPISPSNSGFISAEDAKVIAFHHAEVSVKDAYKIEVELDTDDQIPHYEISFKAGNATFEYEIHAQTAEILECMQDIQKVRTADGSSEISFEQAKSIALIHAGVQESDIWELEIEMDTKNAKVFFEISFHSGAYEYDYEIDAASGTIVKFERDR